jgi:ATP-dependent Clp protease adaptor protein ClpS
MSDTQIKEKPTTVTQVKVNEPGQYKVIYMNDELTTMEFVVETLLDIFDYSPENADKITVKIHEDGMAVVAVLPYEIAEQKGVEVTLSARNSGYPLLIKIEPTD